MLDVSQAANQTESLLSTETVLQTDKLYTTVSLETPTQHQFMTFIIYSRIITSGM